MTDSNVSANTATGFGAGMNLVDCVTDLTGVVVDGNVGTHPTVSLGGALKVDGGSFTAKESTFSNNVAEAGALLRFFESAVDIETSVFDGNSNSGGNEGQHMMAESSVVSLAETEFTGSSVGAEDHALFFKTATSTTIDGCTFGDVVDENGFEVYATSDTVVRNSDSLLAASVEQGGGIVAGCSYANNDDIGEKQAQRRHDSPR